MGACIFAHSRKPRTTLVERHSTLKGLQLNGETVGGNVESRDDD